jgi:hypothetical protein
MGLLTREGPSVPNIGPRGIRRRRTLGITALLAGLVLLVILRVLGAGLAWTLLTFPLFWTAGIGFLQAREKT